MPRVASIWRVIVNTVIKCLYHRTRTIFFWVAERLEASQKTLFHGVGAVLQFLVALNEELPTYTTAPSFYKNCYLDANFRTPHKIISPFLREALCPLQPLPEFHRADIFGINDKNVKKKNTLVEGVFLLAILIKSHKISSAGSKHIKSHMNL